jgi:hypothetical protein
MKEIANFFWMGNLTLYEKMCIKSFVKHNFIVRVWSYDKLENLPDGVELCDANKIIPWNVICNASQPMSDMVPDKKDNHAKYAVFSDIFRAHAGSAFDGWYFDSDCFCLKDQEEFKLLRQNKEMVISYIEKDNYWYVNSAAMFLTPKISDFLSKKTIEKCEAQNYTFNGWAEIGPVFISNIIKDHNMSHMVGKYTDFYALSWNDINHFMDPLLLQDAIRITSDSYVTHIWNAELSQKYDIKNKIPPQGSFLDYLLKGLE